MDENDLLQKLSEQVQAQLQLAEEERKRREVEEERLIETRKLRVAQEQQSRVLWTIFERYAGLGEQVTGQVQMVNNLIEAINHLFAFSEWFEELSERFEAIEHNQRLALELQRLSAPRMRNGSKEKLEQIIKDIDNGPQIVALRRQLSTLHRRLGKLKEQKALKGADAPAALLIEIENTEAEISEVEAKLDSLTEDQ